MVEYGDGGHAPFGQSLRGSGGSCFMTKAVSRGLLPGILAKEPAIRDRRMLNSRKGLEASSGTRTHLKCSISRRLNMA